MIFLLGYIHVYVIPGGDSAEVVFNYSVPLRKLTYVKSGDAFEGRYRLEMEVYRGKELYTSVVKDYYEDVDSIPPPDITRSRYFSIYFPAGDYRFNIRLLDKVSRSLIDSARVSVSIRRSDVQIGSLITVFPNEKLDLDPRREYMDSDSTIYIRIPIYSTREETLRIKVILEPWKGKRRTMEFTYALSKGYNEIPLDYDISDLGFDQYELIVEFYDSRGKRIGTRKMKFARTGFLSLTDVQRKDLISVLEFVYPGEFTRYLKKYDGDFRKAWDNFWKDRDPTPNTPENELKQQFLERYRYAMYNFTRYGRINDMGKIYIKYGPPDYIYREDFSLEGRAYQIWYYQSINRKFIFVDKYGTGDYELVPPGYYDYY